MLFSSYFFFCKQKTAYEMRISDWSSDVCSSDLAVPAGRLTMIEQGLQVQASTFAYGRRYVARANALPVDPVSLVPMSEPGSEERVPAAGLAMFGALRDATPDAWGRRVIENRLRAPPNGLPESVYLDHRSEEHTSELQS